MSDLLQYGTCTHGRVLYPGSCLDCDPSARDPRTLFTTAEDGGGLPDTWKLFTLADQFRLMVAGEPSLGLGDAEREALQTAILEQKLDPDVVLPFWVDCWTRRLPAAERGWRVWYHQRIVIGQTREEWAALPDDGVLAVVVDLPDLDFATIRTRSINAGHGRTFLQSRDPFWWDDEWGHPRDQTTLAFKDVSPEPRLVKGGCYISNPGMGALRIAAVASLNWAYPVVDWKPWALRIETGAIR